MSRVCQITGKSAMSGNYVSHSNHKTRRLFNINLSKRRFYLPEEDRWIELKVTTSGVKYINKVGLQTALKNAVANGFITKY